MIEVAELYVRGTPHFHRIESNECKCQKMEKQTNELQSINEATWERCVKTSQGDGEQI